MRSTSITILLNPLLVTLMISKVRQDLRLCDDKSRMQNRKNYYLIYDKRNRGNATSYKIPLVIGLPKMSSGKIELRMRRESYAFEKQTIERF